MPPVRCWMLAFMQQAGGNRRQSGDGQWKLLAGGLLIIGIIAGANGASVSASLSLMAAGALIAGLAMVLRPGLRGQGAVSLIAAVVLFNLSGNKLPDIAAGPAATKLLGAVVLLAVAVVGVKIIFRGPKGRADE